MSVYLLPTADLAGGIRNDRPIAELSTGLEWTTPDNDLIVPFAGPELRLSYGGGNQPYRQILGGIRFGF